ACTSCTVDSAVVFLFGVTRTATRAAWGTLSRSSPSRLAASSAIKMFTPVALPPRRARLPTKPSLTRVSAAAHTDRVGRGGNLCRARGRRIGARDDYVHLPADQIGNQLRIGISATFRPAVLDHHVLALDEAQLLEATPEIGHARD